MPLKRFVEQPQFENTDHIVDEWLQERQELLVVFSEVSMLEPFDEACSDSLAERLDNFCNILIDYVSAGHFEVFEKIAEASEKSDSSISSLERKDMEKILRTTILSLEFNDKYSNGERNLIDLQKDLSLLGEQLASRLECEDNLIGNYLASTSTKKTKH